MLPMGGFGNEPGELLQGEVAHSVVSGVESYSPQAGDDADNRGQG